MVCIMNWIWGQRFTSASSCRGIGPPNRAFPLCFPSHLLGLRHMGTSSPLPALSFPVSMQNKRQAITLCQTCDWVGGRPLVFMTAWLLSVLQAQSYPHEHTQMWTPKYTHMGKEVGSLRSRPHEPHNSSRNVLLGDGRTLDHTLLVYNLCKRQPEARFKGLSFIKR